MKLNQIDYKITLGILLALFIVACSSDAETETEIPDTTQQPEPEPEPEPDNTPLDTDNDGVPDSEDMDDDGDGLIEIFSIDGLNAMRTDPSTTGKQMAGLAKNEFTGFELTQDFDFENPDHYDDPSLLESYTTGEGWEPIGEERSFGGENGEVVVVGTRFGSIFEGNNFTIGNLFINRPEDFDIGLFGVCSDDSVLRNLNLELKTVTGKQLVAGLAGLGRGLIENCTVSGTVIGISEVGLITGLYEGGTIINCNTSGTVEGFSFLGGLVGRLVIDPFSDNSATISSCSSSATVLGTSSTIGGLIGSWNREDAINAELMVLNSYAIGNIEGTTNLGGLVGSANGTFTSCFASGDINSTETTNSARSIGGLIGGGSSLTVQSCYATGNVTTLMPLLRVGGLCGTVISGEFLNCYAISNIPSNGEEIGGFIGRIGPLGAMVESCYWDTVNSNTSNTWGDAQGLTTSELQTPTSNTGIYADWDPAVWDFGTASQYPALRDMPNGLEVQR